MTSRERILAVVAQNQPDKLPLPGISFFKGDTVNVVDKFISTLTTIGGAVYKVANYGEIADILKEHYKSTDRVITLIPELAGISNEVFVADPDAHPLENVELAVIKGHFAVAENGSVWITEDLMGHRALPFITQHLSVVINEADVLPTMHEAYQRIGESVYGFGSFIAGPSKTADIEQSLVIGAHGSRSMKVFLLA
jgi:L-lactate dehydrogenase complex protein LldG